MKVSCGLPEAGLPPACLMMRQMRIRSAFSSFHPPTADTSPYAVGGVGIPYGISAKSAHPDLAAEYINMISSPEVARHSCSGLGFLPAVPVAAGQLTEGTLTTDLVNAWNLISSNNKVGHYLDWAVPLDDINAALQELLAKQITPEEFVNQVEDAYVAAAP